MAHEFAGALHVATTDDGLWRGSLAAAGLAPMTERGSAAALYANGGATYCGQIEGEAIVAALHGRPYALDPDRQGEPLALAEIAQRLIAQGPAGLAAIGGPFACALIRPERGSLLLACDRFATENLFYVVSPAGVAFANRSRLLASHPAVGNRFSAQAIYDYLYFHALPAPLAGYLGMDRLLPGHYMEWSKGNGRTAPYWEPRYREDAHAPREQLQAELRSTLKAAVERRIARADRLACFLSGGLDSSTTTGLCADSKPGRVAAFTIGFDAAGYDEMAYAATVATHFRVPHHTYYVTPADIPDTLPAIVGAFDGPFGNASAVPTYFCAKLAAAAGFPLIIAGDGGDELFGGNTRYAKQLVFERYQRLPQWLRSQVIGPLDERRAAAGRAPLLGKLGSYVRQARVPLPDRLMSYNLLHRIDPGSFLAPDLLAAVDVARPLRLLREMYSSPDTLHCLNALLRLDWRLTLADSDLPKVSRMCALAGIEVSYPMLDEQVFDYAARLSADAKVSGGILRPLYRDAYRGYLPAQTLAKSKHGFGLPFGVWLRESPILREMVAAELAQLEQRDVIQRGFRDRYLAERVGEHAAYYGTLVWSLVCLAQWLAQSRVSLH